MHDTTETTRPSLMTNPEIQFDSGPCVFSDTMCFLLIINRDPIDNFYTERNGQIIILLAGGNKRTQASDIKLALKLAHNL